MEVRPLVCQFGCQLPVPPSYWEVVGKVSATLTSLMLLITRCLILHNRYHPRHRPGVDITEIPETTHLIKYPTERFSILKCPAVPFTIRITIVIVRCTRSDGMRRS